MNAQTKRPDDKTLLELLAKKRADLACPICKHDDVMLLDSDVTHTAGVEEASLFQIYRFEPDKRPHQVAGIKTVAVACANCGFVRQFVLDVLLRDTGSPK